VAFFLAIGSHYFFKAASGGLATKSLGAKGLAELRIIEAGIAILFVVLVLRVRWHRARLSTVILSFCGAGALFLLSLPVLLQAFGASYWLLSIMILSGALLNEISVYGSWVLITTCVGKRPLHQIAAFGVGGQVAMLLTSTAIPSLLKSYSVGTLCTFSGIGYVFAFGLLGIGMRAFAGRGIRLESQTYWQADPIKGILGDTLSAVRISYLRALSTVIICTLIFKAGLNWNIYLLAESAPDVKTAVVLLAGFYKYSSIACIGAQVVLVPLAFRFVTPKWGLFILPFVGFAALGSVYLSTGYVTLFLGLALFGSLDYTVNNCMRESLFVRMPLHAKVHVKSVMALLVPKCGNLCGAGLVLGLTHLPSGARALVLGAVAIGWCAAAWQVRYHYVRSEDAELDVVVTCVDEAKSAESLEVG